MSESDRKSMIARLIAKADTANERANAALLAGRFETYHRRLGQVFAYRTAANMLTEGN